MFFEDFFWNHNKTIMVEDTLNFMARFIYFLGTWLPQKTQKSIFHIPKNSQYLVNGEPNQKNDMNKKDGELNFLYEVCHQI